MRIRRARNDRVTSAASLVAAAFLLAGCATAGDPGASAVQRIVLHATPLNAGEVGYAYLIPRERHTDLVIKVSGVTPWVTRPVHLYVGLQDGACASTSPPGARSLADRVLARRDPDGFLTLNQSLPADLEPLRGSDRALVVRSSPADANMLLFCGDLHTG